MGDGRGESWGDAIDSRRSKDYWRSLADLLDQPPEAGEFPPGSDTPPDGVSRRTFLGLMGASMALAGATGCAPKPAEKILPYTEQPPEVLPGIPVTYATSMVIDGVATGLLVDAREGRPIKVEGNPEHPASLGATGVAHQASILSLYDPHRGEALRQGKVPRAWRSLQKAFSPAEGAPGNQRLAFLMEPTSSPLTVELIEQVRRRHPQARFFFHSPLMTGASVEAALALYGRPVATQLHLDRARVIVSLDEDLLASGPHAVRHARGFAAHRDAHEGEMSRLYVAEPHWTPTGTTADHRLRMRGSRIVELARGLAAELLGARFEGPRPKWRADAPETRWVQAAAADLRAHQGAGLVTAGERQPPEAHALAHLINDALGNLGKTVTLTEHPIHGVGTEAFDLQGLARSLDAGEVDTLVVLGGNPVYTALPSLNLGERFAKAGTQIYLGEYENETARACEWYVPRAHYLESWGDARSWDGTISTVQPLIRPLHGGRTEAELLSVFLGATGVSAREIVLRSWERRGMRVPFDAALHRGVVEGSAFPSLQLRPRAGGLASLRQEPPSEGMEIVISADPKVHDGRFANNAWLLELPDPVTTLTWENAAQVSPRTAEGLGVETGDLVQVAVGDTTVSLPALVTPGLADETVAVTLGWGRAGAEALARGRGANVYPLRSDAHPWFVPGAKVTRGKGRRKLALTQEHWTMEGRAIALSMPRKAFEANPDVLHAHKEVQPTLRADFPEEGVQWGMAIDLSLCTGCNACVVACQAENNIPVVGQTNVRKGREMHWLRLDRYFTGDVEDPGVVNQPMMCQHCERAPCEYVCPVNATVHSPDGINEMTYNRCVGTRFCSNNCPYKVRRFNWFDFNDGQSDLEQLVHNPDVTVRARGVMEKCTYCVQRVRRAQNASRNEGEAFEPGQIKTACQQACPTEAILFGPVSDPESKVSRKHADHRTYKVLNEFGTEPRTQYLLRITNPNPELSES